MTWYSETKFIVIAGIPAPTEHLVLIFQVPDFYKRSRFFELDKVLIVDTETEYICTAEELSRLADYYVCHGLGNVLEEVAHEHIAWWCIRPILGSPGNNDQQPNSTNKDKRPR